MRPFFRKDESMVDGTYTFHDYCEVSTCAGVIDWYRAKTYLGKVFWAIILIAALALTAFSLYSAIADFLDPDNHFQTVTTMKTGLDNRPFPNVTVCNFNRINISKMREHNISDQRIFEFSLAALPVNYQLPLVELAKRPALAHIAKEHAAAWRSFVNTRHNGVEPVASDLLQKFGHDCKSSVLLMGFQTESFPNPCEKAQEVITNFGRCFTFNMGHERQLFPGASMGLQMIINPALDVYLNGSVINNYLQEGIVLSFDYVAEPLLANPVVVAPGTAAFISLRLSQQLFQEEQYPMFTRPCLENPKLEIIEGNYTKRLCNYDCILKQLLKICGCIPPIKVRSNYKLCSVNETMACYAPFLGNVNQTHMHDLIGREAIPCSNQCLEPCDGTTTVHTSVTTTRFPVSSGISELQQVIHAINDGRLNDQTLRVKDLISIDAYFPVMEILTITTSEATPIFTFIGNIGGQLGMWSGMCLMTVIQAVYFLMACFFQRICTKPNRNRQVAGTEMNAPNLANKNMS